MENRSKITVLATGVFDDLHSEHLKFLQKAKEAGDVLIVGVESDVRVRKMKGEGRPFQDEQTRVKKLEELEYVDKVMLLPDKFDTWAEQEALIRVVRPDILAVSSHTSHQKGKREIMAIYGGRVVIVHDWNPKVSTTINSSKISDTI